MEIIKTFTTQVALVDNKIANEVWIVVVSPRTGNRLAVPCDWSEREIGVVLKTREALQDFGDTTLEFTAHELREFYETWRAYNGLDDRLYGES